MSGLIVVHHTLHGEPTPLSRIILASSSAADASHSPGVQAQSGLSSDLGGCRLVDRQRIHERVHRVSVSVGRDRSTAHVGTWVVALICAGVCCSAGAIRTRRIIRSAEGSAEWSISCSISVRLTPVERAETATGAREDERTDQEQCATFHRHNPLRENEGESVGGKVIRQVCEAASERLTTLGLTLIVIGFVVPGADSDQSPERDGQYGQPSDFFNVKLRESEILARDCKSCNRLYVERLQSRASTTQGLLCFRRSKSRLSRPSAALMPIRSPDSLSGRAFSLG